MSSSPNVTKSNLVFSGYLIVNTLLTLNRLVVELVHKSKGIKKVGLVMAWDFVEVGTLSRLLPITAAHRRMEVYSFYNSTRAFHHHLKINPATHLQYYPISDPYYRQTSIHRRLSTTSIQTQPKADHLISYPIPPEQTVRNQSTFLITGNFYLA